MADRIMLVKDLPAPLIAALKEVGYGRRDIRVETATSYSPGGAGGDGFRSFSVAVDLDTGHSKVLWGSWGGANMFNPQNQVDLDDKSYPLPTNGAVVKGTTGGSRPVYAYIVVNAANMAKLLPASDVAELTPQEMKALHSIGGLKSSGRADEFRRNGLGEYGPANPLVKALVEKKMLKVSPSGITLTLDGKNVREQTRYKHFGSDKMASDTDNLKPVYDFADGIKKIPGVIYAEVDDWATLSKSPFAAEVQIFVDAAPIVRGRLTRILMAWVTANKSKYPGIGSVKVTPPRANHPSQFEGKSPSKYPPYAVTVYFNNGGVTAAKVAGSSYVEVTPAYGRDYKSKAEVVAAWEAGKDFILQDMSSPYDGKPINKQDAAGIPGLRAVNLRYKKNTQVAVVKVATALEQEWAKLASAPESVFWKFVHSIGWGTKTTDSKKIKEGLMTTIDLDFANSIRDTGHMLKGKLGAAIDRWEQREESDPVTGKWKRNPRLPVGDDSYEDLRWHIIGLGKAEYEKNLANPELAYARAVKGDYKESFAYAIPNSYDFKDYERENQPKQLDLKWGSSLNGSHVMATELEKAWGGTVKQASRSKNPFIPPDIIAHMEAVNTKAHELNSEIVSIQKKMKSEAQRLNKLAIQKLIAMKAEGKTDEEFDESPDGLSAVAAAALFSLGQEWKLTNAINTDVLDEAVDQLLKSTSYL